MYKTNKKYFILLGTLAIIFSLLSNNQVKATTWVEPACDPTANPAGCAVSPPLNTSSDTQVKDGTLYIGDISSLGIATGPGIALNAASGGISGYSGTGSQYLKIDPTQYYSGVFSPTIPASSLAFEYYPNYIGVSGTSPSYTYTNYTNLRLGYYRTSSDYRYGWMDIYFNHATNPGIRLLGSTVRANNFNTQSYDSSLTTYNTMNITAGKLGTTLATSYAGDINMTAYGTATAGSIDITAGGPIAGTNYNGSVNVNSYGTGNIVLTPNDNGKVQVKGNGVVEITRSNNIDPTSTNPALLVTNNDSDSIGVSIDNNVDKTALNIDTSSIGTNYGVYIKQGGSANGLQVEVGDANAIVSTAVQGYGAWGTSTNSIGVRGDSTTSYGMFARTQTGEAALRSFYGDENETLLSTANYSAEFDQEIKSDEEMLAKAFIPTSDRYSLQQNKVLQKSFTTSYKKLTYNAWLGWTWSTDSGFEIEGLVWDGSYMWGVDEDNILVQMDSYGTIINRIDYETDATIVNTFRDIIDADDYIVVLTEHTDAVHGAVCATYSINKKTFAVSKDYREGRYCYGAVFDQNNYVWIIMRLNSYNESMLYAIPPEGGSDYTPSDDINLYDNGCTSPRDIAYGGNHDDAASAGSNNIDVFFISCSGSDDRILVHVASTPVAVDNTFTDYFSSIDYPNKLFFDGKYLWVSSESSSAEGLYKYDIDFTTTRPYSGPIVKSITDIGAGIRSISYDGANIWALNTDTQELAVIPMASDDTDYYTYDEDWGVALAYDGNRMWVTGDNDGDGTENGVIRYYTTSSGSFNITNPSVYRGVIMDSNTGNDYCAYIDDTSGTPQMAFVSYATDPTRYTAFCTGNR